VATQQGALTVIAEVKPREVEDLRNLLKKIDEDVENNPIVPFSKLKTVHFARWVVLDETKDAYGERIPPTLALSTNYDEPLDGHLDELLDVAGPGVDQIYGHCEGYPAPGQRTRANILAFLQARMVAPATFYIGTRGRSVEQIRNEARLRDAIEGFLDRQEANGDGGWSKRTPYEVRRAIQDFVRREASLSWALTPEPETPLEWKLQYYGKAAAKVLVTFGALFGPALAVATFARSVWRLPGLATAGVFGLVAAAPIALWAVLLRIHEERDARNAPPIVPMSQHKEFTLLAAREDFIVQNQFTKIANVKPGWFRLLTLRLVFWFVSFGTDYIFTKGKLAKIPSIHFARWVMIDKGKRLVFFSNYDGSWENYLGDFIDKTARGLTAIWSNTVGFPQTRWLINGGAKGEQGFKTLARLNQVHTDVWYSAYKWLSVENINNNSAIRAGLWGEMDEEATRAWLRKL
jgi:hypothetical protein